MKKVVLSVLVLALAPLADAATVSLVLDGGGTTVTPGATVAVDVIADWDVSLNAGFNLMESTTSAAGDATASGVRVLNAGFDLINARGLLCNVQSGTRFMLIDRISGVIDEGSPAITAGDPLYSFGLVIPVAAVIGDTFTIDDAFGDPVVHAGPPYGTGIHGGGIVTDIESLTLVVVPEPMTVVLLTVGGLFIRRRR